VRVFTSRNSPKVKRIRQDPRVTLVVSNELSEYEAWVSFDGTAKITVDNATEKFLDKLASKYWDLSDPDRKATLDSWKADPAQFYVLELVPTQIRTNVD
jgi:general stress protein 26